MDQEDIFVGMPIPTDEEMATQLEIDFENELFKAELLEVTEHASNI